MGKSGPLLVRSDSWFQVKRFSFRRPFKSMKSTKTHDLNIAAYTHNYEENDNEDIKMLDIAIVFDDEFEDDVNWNNNLEDNYSRREADVNLRSPDNESHLGNINLVTAFPIEINSNSNANDSVEQNSNALESPADHPGSNTEMQDIPDGQTLQDAAKVYVENVGDCDGAGKDCKQVNKENLQTESIGDQKDNHDNHVHGRVVGASINKGDGEQGDKQDAFGMNNVSKKGQKNSPRISVKSISNTSLSHTEKSFPGSPFPKDETLFDSDSTPELGDNSYVDTMPESITGAHTTQDSFTSLFNNQGSVYMTRPILVDNTDSIGGNLETMEDRFEPPASYDLDSIIAKLDATLSGKITPKSTYNTRVSLKGRMRRIKPNSKEKPNIPEEKEGDDEEEENEEQKQQQKEEGEDYKDDDEDEESEEEDDDEEEKSRDSEFNEVSASTLSNFHIDALYHELPFEDNCDKINLGDNTQLHDIETKKKRVDKQEVEVTEAFPAVNKTVKEVFLIKEVDYDGEIIAERESTNKMTTETEDQETNTDKVVDEECVITVAAERIIHEIEYKRDALSLMEEVNSVSSETDTETKMEMVENEKVIDDHVEDGGEKENKLKNGNEMDMIAHVDVSRGNETSPDEMRIKEETNSEHDTVSDRKTRVSYVEDNQAGHKVTDKESEESVNEEEHSGTVEKVLEKVPNNENKEMEVDDKNAVENRDSIDDDKTENEENEYDDEEEISNTVENCTYGAEKEKGCKKEENNKESASRAVKDILLEEKMKDLGNFTRDNVIETEVAKEEKGGEQREIPENMTDDEVDEKEHEERKQYEEKEEEEEDNDEIYDKEGKHYEEEEAEEESGKREEGKQKEIAENKTIEGMNERIKEVADHKDSVEDITVENQTLESVTKEEIKEIVCQIKHDTEDVWVVENFINEGLKEKESKEEKHKDDLKCVSNGSSRETGNEEGVVEEENVEEKENKVEVVEGEDEEEKEDEKEVVEEEDEKEKEDKVEVVKEEEEEGKNEDEENQTLKYAVDKISEKESESEEHKATEENVIKEGSRKIGNEKDEYCEIISNSIQEKLTQNKGEGKSDIETFKNVISDEHTEKQTEEAEGTEAVANVETVEVITNVPFVSVTETIVRTSVDNGDGFGGNTVMTGDGDIVSNRTTGCDFGRASTKMIETAGMTLAAVDKIVVDESILPQTKIAGNAARGKVTNTLMYEDVDPNKNIVCDVAKEVKEDTWKENTVYEKGLGGEYVVDCIKHPLGVERDVAGKLEDFTEFNTEALVGNIRHTKLLKEEQAEIDETSQSENEVVDINYVEADDYVFITEEDITEANENMKAEGIDMTEETGGLDSITQVDDMMDRTETPSVRYNENENVIGCEMATLENKEIIQCTDVFENDCADTLVGIGTVKNEERQQHDCMFDLHNSKEATEAIQPIVNEQDLDIGHSKEVKRDATETDSYTTNELYVTSANEEYSKLAEDIDIGVKETELYTGGYRSEIQENTEYRQAENIVQPMYMANENDIVKEIPMTLKKETRLDYYKDMLSTKSQPDTSIITDGSCGLNTETPVDFEVGIRKSMSMSENRKIISVNDIINKNNTLYKAHFHTQTTKCPVKFVSINLVEGKVKVCDDSEKEHMQENTTSTKDTRDLDAAETLMQPKHMVNENGSVQETPIALETRLDYYHGALSEKAQSNTQLITDGSDRENNETRIDLEVGIRKSMSMSDNRKIISVNDIINKNNTLYKAHFHTQITKCPVKFVSMLSAKAQPYTPIITDGTSGENMETPIDFEVGIRKSTSMSENMNIISVNDIINENNTLYKAHFHTQITKCPVKFVSMYLVEVKVCWDSGEKRRKREKTTSTENARYLDTTPPTNGLREKKLSDDNEYIAEEPDTIVPPTHGQDPLQDVNSKHTILSIPSEQSISLGVGETKEAIGNVRADNNALADEQQNHGKKLKNPREPRISEGDELNNTSAVCDRPSPNVSIPEGAEADKHIVSYSCTGDGIGDHSHADVDNRSDIEVSNIDAVDEDRNFDQVVSLVKIDLPDTMDETSIGLDQMEFDNQASESLCPSDTHTSYSNRSTQAKRMVDGHIGDKTIETDLCEETLTEGVCHSLACGLEDASIHRMHSVESLPRDEENKVDNFGGGTHTLTEDVSKSNFTLDYFTKTLKKEDSGSIQRSVLSGEGNIINNAPLSRAIPEQAQITVTPVQRIRKENVSSVPEALRNSLSTQLEKKPVDVGTPVNMVNHTLVKGSFETKGKSPNEHAANEFIDTRLVHTDQSLSFTSCSEMQDALCVSEIDNGESNIHNSTCGNATKQFWGKTEDDIKAYAKEFECLTSVESFIETQEMKECKPAKDMDDDRIVKAKLDKTKSGNTYTENIDTAAAESKSSTKACSKLNKNRKITKSDSVATTDHSRPGYHTQVSDGSFEVEIMLGNRETKGHDSDTLPSHVILLQPSEIHAQQSNDADAAVSSISDSSSRENTSRIEFSHSISQISQFDVTRLDQSTFSGPPVGGNSKDRSRLYSTKSPQVRERNEFTSYREINADGDTVAINGTKNDRSELSEPEISRITFVLPNDITTDHARSKSLPRRTTESIPQAISSVRSTSVSPRCRNWSHTSQCGDETSGSGTRSRKKETIEIGGDPVYVYVEDYNGCHKSYSVQDSKEVPIMLRNSRCSDRIPIHNLQNSPVIGKSTKEADTNYQGACSSSSSSSQADTDDLKTMATTIESFHSQSESFHCPLAAGEMLQPCVISTPNDTNDPALPLDACDVKNRLFTKSKTLLPQQSPKYVPPNDSSAERVIYESSCAGDNTDSTNYRKCNKVISDPHSNYDGSTSTRKNYELLVKSFSHCDMSESYEIICNNDMSPAQSKSFPEINKSMNRASLSEETIDADDASLPKDDNSAWFSYRKNFANLFNMMLVSETEQTYVMNQDLCKKSMRPTDSKYTELEEEDKIKQRPPVDENKTNLHVQEKDEQAAQIKHGTEVMIDQEKHSHKDPEYVAMNAKRHSELRGTEAADMKHGDEAVKTLAHVAGYTPKPPEYPMPKMWNSQNMLGNEGRWFMYRKKFSNLFNNESDNEKSVSFKRYRSITSKYHMAMLKDDFDDPPNRSEEDDTLYAKAKSPSQNKHFYPNEKRFDVDNKSPYNGGNHQIYPNSQIQSDDRVGDGSNEKKELTSELYNDGKDDSHQKPNARSRRRKQIPPINRHHFVGMVLQGNLTNDSAIAQSVPVSSSNAHTFEDDNSTLVSRRADIIEDITNTQDISDPVAAALRMNQTRRQRSIPRVRHTQSSVRNSLQQSPQTFITSVQSGQSTSTQSPDHNSPLHTLRPSAHASDDQSQKEFSTSLTPDFLTEIIENRSSKNKADVFKQSQSIFNPRVLPLPEIHSTPHSTNEVAVDELHRNSLPVRSEPLPDAKDSHSPGTRRLNRPKREMHLRLRREAKSPQRITEDKEPPMFPPLTQNALKREGAMNEAAGGFEEVFVDEDDKDSSLSRRRRSISKTRSGRDISTGSDQGMRDGGGDVIEEIIQPPQSNVLPAGMAVDAQVMIARLASDSVSNLKNKKTYKSVGGFLRSEIPRPHHDEIAPKENRPSEVRMVKGPFDAFLKKALLDHFDTTSDSNITKTTGSVRSEKYPSYLLTEEEKAHQKVLMEEERQARARELTRQKQSVARLVQQRSSFNFINKSIDNHIKEMNDRSSSIASRILPKKDKNKDVPHIPEDPDQTELKRKVRKGLNSRQHPLDSPSSKRKAKNKSPCRKILTDSFYHPDSNVLSVVVKPVNIDLPQDNLNLKVQVHRANEIAKQTTPKLEPHPPSEEKPPGIQRIQRRIKIKRPNPPNIPVLTSNIVDLRAINPPFDTTSSPEAHRRFKSLYSRWKIY